MSWLAIKKATSIAFAWCKKNIKFIWGLVVAIILMLLFRKDSLKQLGELWNSEDELYKERRRQLEEQHEAEINRNQRHAEVEEELRKQGRQEAERLREEHKNIIEENKDKTPEEIAKLISEHTGWDIN